MTSPAPAPARVTTGLGDSSVGDGSVGDGSGGYGSGGASRSAVRTGPSGPTVRRGVRVAAILLVIVVGYTVLSVVLSRPTGEGYLDINSPAPDGSRALASILGDRGVDVSGTGDVHDVLDSAPSTVVVVFPGALSPWQLEMVGKLDDAGHDVVLVAPDEAVLDNVGVPLTELGVGGSAVLEPDCELPEARVAGNARVGGGRTYGDVRADDAGSTTVATCYPADDDQAALAVVREGAPSATEPDADPEGGRVVVLGDAAFLTNRYLDSDGNAALALALLNRHPSLLWLIPTAPSDEAVSASVSDLLGETFWLVVAQLAAALVVLALWRGRRLGPIVAEPLPVVVRAAETVEGRGRLYAAARARDRAAATLRTSVAARLADRLGVTSRPGASTGPAGWPGYLGSTPATGQPAGPDPTALIASVAEHTGRSPVEIGALLYGSDMTYPGGPNHDRVGSGAGEGPDDDALIRLALALDELDRQVDGR